MDERLVHALQQRWGATLIETHISWVLLDGTHAWKIKKPVRLPFLDFSSLATRQRLCEVELTLNRRLAPELYLDVQPICGTPDAPELNGPGPAIDYVLCMKQFPAGALMSERLAAGTLLPEHIDQLAHRLAAFHRAAPVAPASSPYGTPQRIEEGMSKVLDGLAQQGHGQAVSTLQTWATQQAPALRATWAQRHAQGHIVEGHGDLHLANIVVLDDRVTAFDCIEFDPALRWIDPCNDIAFLVMDLMAHQRRDLAFRFLNAYLDQTGDHACLPTLRFYMVYRALVRALVAGIPGAAATARPDYLQLAQHLIQTPAPRLLITHGVSGSGKTYRTQALLERVGAVRVRSDIERQRLTCGQDAAQRYSAQATQQTYDKLIELAAIGLQAGYPVIVDATFLHPAERERFQQLALHMHAPFHILHCEAPLGTLQQRLRTRQAEGRDASEADEAVLARQLDGAAPLTVAELAFTTPMYRQVDVCNGDADGLCALVQWRLHEPLPATLITGLKRDIQLLKRVQAQAGDQVNVFDVSMQRNQQALRALLDAGVHVQYADHHEAGDIPSTPLLSAHIDQASDTCTSLIVDQLLQGARRAWALVGAYGDNLSAVADHLAAQSGLSPAHSRALRQLGEAINYNAYGDVDTDVCIPPARLFELMRRYADPLVFMANEPIAADMLAHRDADLQKALSLPAHSQDDHGAVYRLPNEPWSRRVSGTFANALANASPDRAHAVLTLQASGAYVVSVRAPLTRPSGAGALCQQFGGSGRARAAGLDALPAPDVPRFIEAFKHHNWGA